MNGSGGYLEALQLVQEAGGGGASASDLAGAARAGGHPALAAWLEKIG